MPHIALRKWAERWGLSQEDIYGLLNWLAERIATKVQGRLRVAESRSAPISDLRELKIAAIEAQERLIVEAKLLLNHLRTEGRKLEITREGPKALTHLKTEAELLEQNLKKMKAELRQLREVMGLEQS
jgi:uncharacterized protein Smg (DUF494 family)